MASISPLSSLSLGGTPASAPRKLKDISIQEMLEILRSTTRPCGYRPWNLPGGRYSAIVDRSLKHAMEGVSKKALELVQGPKKSPIFSGTDLRIVPDHYKQPMALNQITEKGALKAASLLGRIQANKTAIKMQPGSPFQKKALHFMRIFLTRPSGRQLLTSLAKSPHNIIMMPGKQNTSKIFADKQEIIVILDLDDVANCRCRDKDGNFFIKEATHDIMLFHELCHSYMQVVWKILEGSKAVTIQSSFNEPSPNPDNTKLIEQLAIDGLDGCQVLCENMYRFEIGEPPRDGHISSSYPPFSSVHADRIHEKHPESGLTRMQNAARLGAINECLKLLAWGAHLHEATLVAMKYERTDLLKALLIRGADKYRDEEGAGLVHIAAHHGCDLSLAVLHEFGMDMNDKDQAGSTPLHYGLLAKKALSVIFLLEHGADKEAPYKEVLKPLDIAIVEKNHDCVEALLERDVEILAETLKTFLALEDEDGELAQIGLTLVAHFERRTSPKTLQIAEENPSPSPVPMSDEVPVPNPRKRNDREESPVPHKKPRIFKPIAVKS